MLKDKLQIILITYNREKCLNETFKQIFAENSPIKDFDITILDNASTDGTSELIEEYKLKFPNITHIRHNINIGGNANIVRAFEIGASSDKEYVWVLCDDDKYDFSAWSEVENAIENKKDIICVANYAFPTEKDKTNPAYQISQLSFVPSGIYRTEHITSDVLMNMYDSILTMFQQAVLSISVINKGGSIYVLPKSIVLNGCCEAFSYTRGMKFNKTIEQKDKTDWTLGFFKVISLLENKTIQKDCVYSAINFIGAKNFFRNLINRFKFEEFEYFYSIYKNLPIKIKLEFFVRLLVEFLSRIFILRNIYDKDGTKTKVLYLFWIKFILKTSKP